MRLLDGNVPESIRQRAISTLVAGFTADPFTRWVYPDAKQYLTYFPRIAEALGGKAFDSGTAFFSNEMGGVALWLPPGVEPDREAIRAVVKERGSEYSPDDLAGFSERQSACHPTEDHWYLPLFAVDPPYQNQGIGSFLLRDALSTVDASDLPAYLEATTLENRALYERNGFVVVDEIQYGHSPTMWAMWREPQTR